MQISLSPQIEDLVKAKVESGRYASAGEVVSQALLLLNEIDLIEAKRLETLRREIDKGLHSGASLPAETVFSELKDRYRQAP